VHRGDEKYTMKVGKPLRKILLGRPTTRICEDNIKTDLKELECEDVNWIELVRDRFDLFYFFVNIPLNFLFHKTKEFLPAEFFQAVGKTLRSEIHKLFHSIWNKEELPQQ
jgi:hypothetical protein